MCKRNVLTVVVVALLGSFLVMPAYGGPVRVFIMAGQSNMEGHGEMNPIGTQGTLEYIYNDDPVTYGHLKDGGNWAVRNDVWIYYKRGGTTVVKGGLSAGYGASSTTIGPELQFGHAIGDVYNDQVLLIKTAWGGKSLGVDFRPPSSGWSVNPPVAEGNQGYYYQEMMDIVADVLANLGTYFPGYSGQGYEIVGFGWHQGWNDRVTPSYAAEYEVNMENFIKDVRFDLGRPDMPFVIATTGMDGNPDYSTVELAQLAMGNYTKYPEFEGNVTAIDTQDFWRPVAESPADQGYHWNRNAETYYLIGDSMAGDMATMVDPNPPVDTTAPTPNPMTWSSVPAPASASSIVMTATLASDDLNGVLYKFTCTAGGGHNSGWQASNTYTDTGLLPETQYTYTVMARDTSAAQNATTASTAKSATTDEDHSPPTPNPATFASFPAWVSSSQITMTATTGIDDSVPIAYYFDETSGNPGGTDSGWVTNPVYTDTGLAPETQYTYTVQMRDPWLNTGTASAPASETTPEANPPTPNPATFASPPAAVNDTQITMTATTGDDETGPVEYFFDETSGHSGATDSGWTTNPVYNDKGLSPDTQYTYTVRMRDSIPNTGTASAPASATTYSEGSITVAMPNSGFELIYKPGQTVITGVLSTDAWNQGVGPGCPIDSGSGTYNFSDASSGTVADIPGWLGYDRNGWIALGGTYSRDETTGNLQGSVASQGPITGAHCYLANGGGWGNPAGGLITSAASLGDIQSNSTYTLSMYANGSAAPVALKLLADGAVVTPTYSANPTSSGVQEFFRTYSAADLASYVGQALTIVCGIDRNASGTQTKVDDVSLTYYELPGGGDINLDGRINLVDFAQLAAYWLEIDCNVGNNFCSGADINEADGVGLDDLLIMAGNWLKGVPRLMAHWKFDESSGTVASNSIGDNDGTLYGDPKWHPSGGQIGGALEFDGAGDYVEVAGYKGISGSNPRTVSAWVRVESNGSTFSIVRWGTLGINGGLWSNVINAAGNLRAAVIGGSVVGDTVINDDTWHHVAIVLPDKGNVKVEDILLYVDGEPEDTTISFGSQKINTAVGMDVLISLDGSVGMLDDVRIYDNALSEEEIGALAGVL